MRMSSVCVIPGFCSTGGSSFCARARGKGARRVRARQLAHARLFFLSFLFGGPVGTARSPQHRRALPGARAPLTATRARARAPSACPSCPSSCPWWWTPGRGCRTSPSFARAGSWRRGGAGGRRRGARALWRGVRQTRAPLREIVPRSGQLALGKRRGFPDFEAPIRRAERAPDAVPGPKKKRGAQPAIQFFLF